MYCNIIIQYKRKILKLILNILKYIKYVNIFNINILKCSFHWFILLYHIIISMLLTPGVQQYIDKPTAGSTEAQGGPANDPLLLLFPLIASCRYHEISS
jgi:hypothetical protein